MFNPHLDQIRAFKAANKNAGFSARLRPVAKGSLPTAEVAFDLNFYDAIGVDSWGAGITAETIVGALADARAAGANRLNLFINSPGGDVYEATTIHSIIARYPGDKFVYVDGSCCSAATFIVNVAKTISTVPAGMWMFHNPWGICIGDGRDMAEAKDKLDKVRTIYADAYTKRTGLSQAKIAAIMDGLSDKELEGLISGEAPEAAGARTRATWMNAAQAKALGFTDLVQAASDQEIGQGVTTTTVDLEASANAEARMRAVFARLPNVPEHLQPPVPEHLQPPEPLVQERIAFMEARLSARLQHPRTQEAGQRRTQEATATQILPARH